MLDTITDMPIILAYTFVGLLFTILSFIAIYVSHKVYTTIFGSLPLETIVAANMPKRKMAPILHSDFDDEKDTKAHFQQQQQQKFIAENFGEKYAAKRLQQIVDVKRESRKVA